MKVKTIEQALCWAYRDEWPKAGADVGGYLSAVSAGALAHWVASGEPERVNDGVNRYGVIALRDQRLITEPMHPDADILFHAVQALDEAEFATPSPDDAAPVEDWRDERRASAADDDADWEREIAAAWRKAIDLVTAIDRAGRRVWKAKPSGLVIAHALGLKAQHWRMDAPALELVRNPQGGAAWFRKVRIPVFGRPEKVEGKMEPTVVDYRMIEADGFDAKRRRPYADAYQLWRLDPDPVAALAARAEWRLMCAALDRLVFAMADDGLEARARADASTLKIEPRLTVDAPWAPESARAAAEAAFRRVAA